MVLCSTSLHLKVYHNVRIGIQQKRTAITIRLSEIQGLTQDLARSRKAKTRSSDPRIIEKKSAGAKNCNYHCAKYQNFT